MRTLLWPHIITTSLALVPLAPAGLGAAEVIIAKETESVQSIEQVLEERDDILYDPTSKSLFSRQYLKKFRGILRDWEQKIGLEMTLSYDAIAQGYADTGEELFGTAGDVTLSGRWLLFGTRYTEPMYLSFRLRNRHSLSEYAPADFRTETDLLWGTVDGFNDSGVQLPSLYVTQELLDNRLVLSYGQFTIDHFFDNHAMRGAKRFFLNQAFADNPVVSFPRFGAGFVGHWQGERNWSVTLGGSNVQGTEMGQAVDLDLDSKALFEALQVSYAFPGFGDRAARLQVMCWNSDSNGERHFIDGDGLSLTLEHEGLHKGEQFVFRFGNAAHDPTMTDKLFFVAFGKDLKKYNHLGVGVGAGRSSTTTDWQGVVEMYYRVRVAKELMVTPDIQVIVGDGVDGDDGIRFIAGIRIGLIF